MPSPSLQLPGIPAQFSPLSLLRMCWKHKTGIVVIWVVVTLIAAGVIYSLPVKYTAEAQILIEAQKIPANYVATIVNTDIQDRLATISQQILSTPRLQKIIDDFNLYKKQRKDYVQEEILQMMRKDISVKQDKGWTNNKPGAFRVGYTGVDAAIVAQVANRIANLYIEENMRTRETQAEGTTEFIETQLQETKKQLDQMESAITAYKQRHNGELPEQAAAISGGLSRMQLDQNANREAIARAEASKLMIENTLTLAESTVETLSQLPSPGAVSGAVQDDPAPGNRIAPPPPPKKPSEALEVQLAALRARYSDGHPEIKRLKIEIAAAKMIEAKSDNKEVAQEPKQPPPVAKAKEARPPAPAPALERPALVQARERVQALKSQIELTEKEINGRKAEQDRIVKALVDAQARLTNIPLREQELVQIMRDHANVLANYQSLLGKQTTAKMSTDMEMRQKSERFTIVDPARPPEKPINQDRYALDLMGSFIGLLGGLCFAIAQEFRKDLLLGAWELPGNVVTLARVPRIAPGTGRSPAGAFWKGWGMVKRAAFVSSGLVMLLGLIAAAKIYLKF